MMQKLTVLVIFMAGMAACQPRQVAQSEEAATAARPRAKFEPADGEVILFAGQELEAVGGLENYSDGYLDHFDAPGGFTTYSGISPGDDYFGHTQYGLDGIFQTDNWGDGDYGLHLQLADSSYQNMAVAIGLWLVNHEERVAAGEHDSLIYKLGDHLKNLGDRPVFLRIGYEFDGHAWNHYDKESYLMAYRRIKDKLDSMEVNNVAYVWQSTGWVSDEYLLEEWYPGDDYVDWCAFSFFSRWSEQSMIEFARKKGKPVFIAEATPTISDHMVKFTGDTKHTDLSVPAQAEEAWDRWFVPFFNTIDNNTDVVKAVSYINCYWKSHEMWKDNPTFKRIDARLHLSPLVSERWIQETSKPKYLKSSPTLYDYLWNNNN